MAVSEIHTILTYDHETSFDVHEKDDWFGGNQVLKLLYFEMQNWKQNFLDI